MLPSDAGRLAIALPVSLSLLFGSTCVVLLTAAIVLLYASDVGLPV
jgi:hypothetical protein